MKMKRTFSRRFGFTFKVKVKLLLLLNLLESSNSIKMRSTFNCQIVFVFKAKARFSSFLKVAIQRKWKGFSRVISSLLLKEKVKLLFLVNFLESLNSIKWKGLSPVSLALLLHQKINCAEVSPKKTPPSSKVLNELAEGVVRRTGGRLALAFRIFCMFFLLPDSRWKLILS